MDAERAMHELKRCLSLLASPGREALAAIPDGCVKSDELALEFDDALRVARGAMWPRLTPEARAALEAVDQLLTRMSGEQNQELWTDGAVIAHPRWMEVRIGARLARDLLATQTDADAG
jgi:hypothetical protein